MKYDASDRGFKKLPKGFWETVPEETTELNLSFNMLREIEIPDGIRERLPNLEVLDLDSNKISALSDRSAVNLRKLKRLVLNNNWFKAVPHSLIFMERLDELWMVNNGLKGRLLSSTLPWIKGLRVVYLSDNRITTLPDNLARMEMLNKLYLGRNQFGHVPSILFGLSWLNSLDLSNNQIIEVDPRIGEMNLMYLNLGDNQLTSLPKEIADLRNLKALDVGFNQLTGLPSSIVEMRFLEKLDMEHNQMTHIPTELSDMDCLRFVKLRGCLATSKR